MPVFGDSDNLPPRKLLPEGDYKFCVREFAISISAGGKTAGSERYDIELEIEGQETSVSDILIDHPTCTWKVDTFLKSSGVKLTKNAAFSFNRAEAESQSIVWVNPIGLRGWCRLRQEHYEKNGEKRVVNKVSVYYTDREKLPANKALADAAAEEAAPF